MQIKNNKQKGYTHTPKLGVTPKGGGYTIIETMIAVSLFVIIVMAGMGALLNANLLHQKSQSMRSILDSLSFIMEDMSRNLRVGYDYHCITSGEDSATNPQDCSGNGIGISFKSSTDSGKQWAYYVGYNPQEKNGIFKKIDGVSYQLTPDEVVIENVEVFSVIGAEPPLGDLRQPFVTIKLVGSITLKGVTTPFSLRTSVSQRSVDIGS